MPEPLALTLIVAPRKCAKCDKCRALLARLQDRFAGQLECRICSTDDDAAAAFGVVLPPLLLVGSFVAAMGSVPDEDKLAQLIERKLPAS
jgi:hypothetical protein